METNMLEAIVLLRIARDKLEEEATFNEEKREKFNDAADDIGNILVALGDAADDIASSVLVALETKYGT